MFLIFSDEIHWTFEKIVRSLVTEERRSCKVGVCQTLSGGSTARFCDKQVFLSWVQKKVLGWCLSPQMLITSLSSTYFPCFDHFSCISWQRNFVRDIFPNISPPDHCLKLNPGTNAPWFELFDSESKSSGGWRKTEYQFTQAATYTEQSRMLPHYIDIVMYLGRFLEKQQVDLSGQKGIN